MIATLDGERRAAGGGWDVHPVRPPQPWCTTRESGMPWGRIDDSLYDHPKLDSLGRLRLPCVGLWILSISWCNRHLTDGFVPDARVIRLGGNPGLADALVRVGLFDRVDGGYRIHDYLSFNESKDQVKLRRDSERKRWQHRRNSTPESTPDSGQTPERPVLSVPSHTVPMLIDPQKQTEEEYQEGLRKAHRRKGLPA